MASSSVSTSQPVDVLDCSICAETLSDPRVLPCGHSFCGPPKPCLNSMQRAKSIICALCNKTHKIQLSDLKPLFGIRDFIERYQARNETENEPVVRPKTVQEFCPPECDEGCRNLTSFWCKSCSKRVCEDCLEDIHDKHSVQSYKKYIRESVKKKYGDFVAIQTEFGEKTTDILNQMTTKLAQMYHVISILEGERDALAIKKAEFNLIVDNLPQLEKVMQGTGVCDSDVIDTLINFDSKLPTVTQIPSTKNTQTETSLSWVPDLTSKLFSTKSPNVQILYRSEMRLNFSNPRNWNRDEVIWCEPLYLFGHIFRIGLVKTASSTNHLVMTMFLRYFRCLNVFSHSGCENVKLVVKLLRHKKNLDDLWLTSLILDGKAKGVNETNNSVAWCRLFDSSVGNFLDANNNLWVSVALV
ncbi:uncharacterized protein LOC142343866 [Convolutriloba macropyga]|uniref:uncharacterized protein LOC142343866 n=1 Tax=Convolutriloba macropyga TaxID=536237 RepID=UPI003F52021F